MPPAQPRSGEDVVRFDASGSSLKGPDGTPSRYRFDFGDGTPVLDQASPFAEHVYAASGPVTASVTVRDERSGQVNDSPPGELALTVAPGVRDDAAPTARLVRVSPDGSAFAGRPVRFALQDLVLRAAGAPRFQWDLDGDGSYETDTATSTEVETTYPDTGTRTVRARITDGAGRTGLAGPLEVVVRGTPTRPPLVVLKAPAEVRLTGADVAVELDATGSRGQEEDPTLTYAFDLDGDGTYETPTGTTPKATARLRDRGPVTLGVRATDPYGLSAEKRAEIVVRTTADDLAGCAGSSVLRTVSLGPIGARACFTRIDRGSAGPLFVAFGDVDLNGLRITGADGSTFVPRTFPDCTTADCREAQRAFNQRGGSASIALDLAAGKLWSSRPVALKLTGSEVNLPLSLGPIELDLPFGKGADGFLVRLPPRVGLLGLPVTGEAEVRFPSTGRTQVKVNAALPTIIGGAAVAVDVEARAGEGARLDELLLKLDTSLLAKVVKLRKLDLRYVRADQLFRGALQMELPFPKAFEIGAAIQIKDGALDSLFGEATGLNRLIGKGIFLQGVRAGATTDPVRILGGVQLSAGPRVKLPNKPADDPGIAILLADGDFVLQLPVNGAPAIFGINGRATIANVLPIASASVLVSQNGFVAAKGTVGGTYGPGFFRLGLDAWVASTGFNAAGDASVGLRISGRDVELLGGSAVVSSTGYAACGRIPVLNVGGGLGQRWGERFATFDGCDLGPYTTQRPADLPASLDEVIRPGSPLTTRSLQRADRRLVASTSQATPATGERIDVAPGTPQLAVRLQGAPGAPPEARIVDARGTTVVSTTGGDVLTSRALVQHDVEAGRTSILLKRPPSGALYVVREAGPALRQVRTAVGVAERRVSASVRRTRGGGHVLRWQVRPALLPGQELELAERATTGTRGGAVLLRTTRSSGERRFTPAPGGGRRAILAGVRTDGLVRVQRTVARYTAPAFRPSAARDLRVVRRGRTVRATWRGPRPAGGWTVAWSTTTGRRLEQSLRTPRLTLPELPAAAGVRVSVVPVGPAGERGRTIRAAVAPGQRDSRRASRPADARARGLRLTRRGTTVRVGWRGGPEAVRSWTLALRDARGRTTTLLRPRGATDATFRGVRAGAVRVTVTARRLAGGTVAARVSLRR
ncbi:PKD domain-containing protein [Conexibacter sp. W3-3-2]|uniref:PKD domain-containing protein n=1 Tax=Conexibacter sp. W3-3-2 TaxID=2675227 RepID=UPI002815B91C|nr:PKD domain-containing protein [Conexibacter sp. W3-3-2]